MTDRTIDRDEIDEYDLAELAGYAPDDLSVAAPDWELARDAILRDTIPPTPRHGWLPRIAVAAAALVAVGTGVALVRPHVADVVPGSPGTPLTTATPSQQVSPAGGPLWALADIPSGKYLVRRSSQAESQDDQPGTTMVTRIETYDSQGRFFLVDDGHHYPSYQPPDAKLANAPSDPAQLGPWLVSGHGGTFVPQPPDSNNPTAPPRVSTEDAIGNEVMTYLVDPRVSAGFRQVLVEVARQHSHMVVATTGSRIVVTFDPQTVNGVTHHDQITLDAKSLDPVKRVIQNTAPASAQATTKGRVVHSMLTYLYQPTRLTSTRP